MWINLSLNSALASRDSKKKRFYLDTALTNVCRVHLTAFELTGCNYLLSETSYLYFSEVWETTIPFFRSRIPPGKYNLNELCSILTTAIHCVECINYPSTTPKNSYVISICPQTSSLIIRSNGTCLYALHGSHISSGNYLSVINKVVDENTFQLTVYASVAQPLAVGAMVVVFCDEIDLLKAQVINVTGNILTLRTWSSTSDLLSVEKINISPLSNNCSCHDILGFSEFDVTPDDWVNITGYGKNGTNFVFGTCTPVGGQVGDSVALLHSSHNVHYGTITSLPSFAHIVVSSPSISSVDYDSCKIVGSDTNIPIVCRGLYNVDLGRNRRVVLVRLWLGSTEISGMVCCKKKSVLNVFGRLQLRQQRDNLVSFSGSGDSSVVGEHTIEPPLLRVPYIDVEILSEQGDSFSQAGALGEWTMMLRCCVTHNSP